MRVSESVSEPLTSGTRYCCSRRLATSHLARSVLVLDMDPAALELDAVKFAKTAVTFDQNGKYNEAVFYYKV